MTPRSGALDEAVYSAILGRPIVYQGWFPLVHTAWLVTIFERAYLSLFAEIALAVVVLARQTDALRWFVARLVFCYACGLLFFVGWPVAGPCLVYPASISATFSGLNTRAIMQSSLEEFSAIRFGGQPVTGFGYFVGLPSLHVAMAVLLQFTIQQRSRIGAWVVAPINILIIAQHRRPRISLPGGCAGGRAARAVPPSGSSVNEQPTDASRLVRQRSCD